MNKSYGFGFAGNCRVVRRVHNRSDAPRRRSARILAIVACFAVIVASLAAFAGPARKLDERSPSSIAAPGPPYFVVGYAFDSVGNPIAACAVNITNTATGEWSNATSTDASGYYKFDLNSLSSGFAVGNVINATAYFGAFVGYNVSTVTSGPHLWLNVTVPGIVIPEFADIVIPIVGIMLLVMAVRSKVRTA